MNRFDNYGDAINKLGGTILAYEGRAFRVMDIGERSLKIMGRYLRDDKGIECKQDDPLLSMACPPLGYINTDEEGLFAMRMPARRWKQGVDARAIVVPGERMPRRDFTDKALADCLENIYPDLKTCLGSFENINPFKQQGARKSIAFSKKFGVKKVDGDLRLAYKGRVVGHFQGTDPILDELFIWLSEALEAACQR